MRILIRINTNAWDKYFEWGGGWEPWWEKILFCFVVSLVGRG